MMQTTNLFTPSNLIITTSLFAGMLYGLYPKHETLLVMDQSGEDLKTQFTSPLQTEYARVKIKGNVAPSELLHLAEQLTAQHDWQASSHLLGRLTNHAEENIRQQADWLLLKNRLDAYYSTSANKKISEPMRNAAKQTVRTQLLALAKYQHWDAPQRTALAQYCDSFGLLPQAANHYAQLATLDPAQKQQWLTAAASCAGEAGLWADAEHYLREVRDNTGSFAWMEAAVKAGIFSEVISHLQIIQQHLPDSVSELRQLANLSLKVGKPEIATAIYQKLADIDPSDAQTWHEKAAYWAQAAGLYQTAADALTKAQTLAKNAAEQLSLQQRTVDLWVVAEQPTKAATLLTPLLTQPEYAKSVFGQTVRVAYLAEQQQQDKLASRLWQWILPHTKDAALWKHVAFWQSGKHQYADALSTWGKIETQFGTDNQITLARIQLHWELKQYRSAFKLTQNHHNQLTKLANTYQREILTQLMRKFKNT
jgi:hypothetical protein